MRILVPRPALLQALGRQFAFPGLISPAGARQLVHSLRGGVARGAPFTF